ncbi:MAG TPA: tRNA uridine-5-carboxymethylaminomethyl(34) synthesis GTPase MnmE [Bacteroidales bacterium]|nr:tRNA uridine-5-carboxymethylaminomethyl(34) synthesis GTPase MnmE [Bacteroidales bacterium]
MYSVDRTICAISSPAGTGAIAIVRLSGEKAIELSSNILQFPEKFLKSKSGQLVFNRILDENNEMLDEIMIVKFKSPHSYTGENMTEIYCHGSNFIQNEIVNLLLRQGVCIAKPGEFTKRAFLNSKMDLSQSEAVADIISSNSSEFHRLAINQMKGKVSSEINLLRDKMIELTALMELELDFGEEDVEFADRNNILELMLQLKNRVKVLIDSFRYGNAIKTGVPVVIAGEPNTGKSTLLNVLLKEERAIVSSSPGTTRDTIEEELIIDGIKFRLIDTAGIRKAKNKIENEGVKRSFDSIKKAQLILLVIDAKISDIHVVRDMELFQTKLTDNQYLIPVFNKIDLLKPDKKINIPESLNPIFISAKNNENIDELCNRMTDYVKSLQSGSNDVIITSARHLESLMSTNDALKRAEVALKDGLSGDFVSQDIREAMYFLGEITGQISNEEVLGAIFEKFCIGK